MNQGSEQLDITLSRSPGTPWGFRLQGGADFTTPLSIQSVNPGSVADQCGAKAGDAVLSINGCPSDELEHEKAKQCIVQSGDQVRIVVLRGAVKVWKPKVTPLSQLKPGQFNQVSGEEQEGEDQCIQRTSLAADKQESLNIGSSHNRAARPFPGGGNSQPAAVVHSQFNSPMQMYSADNAEQSYNSSQQLATDMGSLSVTADDNKARSVSPLGRLLQEQESANKSNIPGYLSVTSDARPPRNMSPTARLLQETSDVHPPRNMSPTARLLQEEESGNKNNAPAFLAVSSDARPPRSVSPTARLLLEEESRVKSDTPMSERYKDHADGEEISYKGYTDPSKQSRSFQRLNQELYGGGGSPAAPAEPAQSAAPTSGFRSVRAPTTNTAAQQQQQQQHSTCKICGSLIIGVFVRIKGDPMHAECFKCTTCGMNLKQQGYFQIEGSLYCEAHARQVAQPPSDDMIVDKAVYR